MALKARRPQGFYLRGEKLTVVTIKWVKVTAAALAINKR
jgi:hypothetical protein